MKIFNMMAVILLMTFTVTVNAETRLKSSGLSPEQVAQLELQAAQMVVDAQEAANLPAIDGVLDTLDGLDLSEEALDKYANVGTKVGKIVTGFLTEIGVTTANFLDTKWGVVAMVLVAWHYFANDIAVLMLINLNLFIFLPIWLYFARNVWFPYKKFATGKDKDGGDTFTVKRQYDSDSTIDASGWMIAALGIIIVQIIICVINVG